MKSGLRDIVTGVLITGFGAFVAFYAITNYRLGTVSSMGPGMFPAGLGVLLALFGLIILVQGFVNAAPFPAVEWKPLISVLVSIVAFALVIERFGMIPAVAMTTLASVYAARELSKMATGILVIALCGLAFVIFRLGLNLPIESFQVPF